MSADIASIGTLISAGMAHRFSLVSAGRPTVADASPFCVAGREANRLDACPQAIPLPGRHQSPPSHPLGPTRTRRQKMMFGPPTSFRSI